MQDWLKKMCSEGGHHWSTIRLAKCQGTKQSVACINACKNFHKLYRCWKKCTHTELGMLRGIICSYLSVVNSIPRSAEHRLLILKSTCCYLKQAPCVSTQESQIRDHFMKNVIYFFLHLWDGLCVITLFVLFCILFYRYMLYLTITTFFFPLPLIFICYILILCYK